MRRFAAICMSILLLAALSAQQHRVRGQVRNSNGAPLPKCQVDFYHQQELSYRVYSDRNGYFYLEGPRSGEYDVVVTQGSNGHRFNNVIVSSDGSKLIPDILEVPW